MIKFTIEVYHEADVLLISSALQALAVQRTKREAENESRYAKESGIGQPTTGKDVEPEGAAVAEAEAEEKSETPEKTAPEQPKAPVARKATKSSKRDAQAALQKKQAEKTAEVKQENPQPAAAESTTQAAPTAPAAAAPSAGALPTKAEIDRALRSYANKNGMQAARDLLAKFSIVRLPDLPEAKFAEFMVAMMPTQASSDASTI